MYEEPQKDNDLFFTCSLIEYIARKTKNTIQEIVRKLGEENINKIYEFAVEKYKECLKKLGRQGMRKKINKKSDELYKDALKKYEECVAFIQKVETDRYKRFIWTDDEKKEYERLDNLRNEAVEKYSKFIHKHYGGGKK